MKGYHTGGDWQDITSINRNEVVFEGRHKAYGAYFIRTRYPNTLLLAMFSSVVFIMVCAIIPYTVQHFTHHDLPQILPDEVIVNPVNTFTPVQPIKTETTQPKPLKPTVSSGSNIVIDNRHQIDTAKPDNLPEPIHTDPSAGNGQTNTNPNPNPNPPGGGGGTGVNPIPVVDNTVHPIVSEMPKFPNGSVEEYLRKNTDYPTEERDLRVQGTVIVSFVVEKDGSVSNVKILRGVVGGPGLEAEAKRVISDMPRWTPGKQNGIPARVQFSVPISFRIQ